MTLLILLTLLFLDLWGFGFIVSENTKRYFFHFINGTFPLFHYTVMSVSFFPSRICKCLFFVVIEEKRHKPFLH